MNNVEKDLNLSDSFTKVKSELENLRIKHKEEDKRAYSDTVEALLLFKEYKKDLKLKFKSNSLLNNPDDIIKYFKDNFKDVNTFKLKLYLLSIGFIQFEILYLSLIFIFSYPWYLLLDYQISQKYEMILFLKIVLSFLLSAFSSIIFLLPLFPSTIKSNINQD